jgi:RNA polymerase sigma-70 factor (ECF subfamily)
VDRAINTTRSSEEYHRKISAPAVTILADMTKVPPPPKADGDESRPVEIDWGLALARHDRWLRTAVLARLAERQAVDEVMQEVALAALAQRAPLGDPAKIGPWLYRVAVRRALLYRRQRGRQHKLVDRYAWARGVAPSREADPAVDPLEWLVLDERRGLVREALGRLARRDAEILLLKYTEDWSYHDLAVHLGIAASAVEARLHRARCRLRHALASAPVTAIEVAE